MSTIPRRPVSDITSDLVKKNHIESLDILSAIHTLNSSEMLGDLRVGIGQAYLEMMKLKALNELNRLEPRLSKVRTTVMEQALEEELKHADDALDGDFHAV